MLYQIHGRDVAHNGSECGLYKSPNPVQRMVYAAMDMDLLVQAINGMPIEKAIKQVTQLRDRVAEQARWEYTPQNPGFPILRQVPGSSVSIAEIRANLQNTERFCNDVLKALEGQ